MPEEIVVTPVETAQEVVVPTQQQELLSAAERIRNHMDGRPSNTTPTATPTTEKQEIKLPEGGTQTTAEKQAAQAEIDKAAAATNQQPTTRELTAEDALAFINKHLGTTIGSAEDIKTALADKVEKDRLAGIVNAFGDFTPEEIAIIRAGRDTKDYAHYSRVMSIKPTELSHKDALKIKFDLENPNDPAKWREKEFERKFSADYLVKKPEDETDDDAMKEYNEEKEYRELSLEKYGNDARKYIEGKQTELKKYGNVEGVANHAEQQKAIKAEADKLRAAWAAKVDQTLETAQPISYTIDGVQVNVAMDVAEKAVVRKAMDDPDSFVQQAIGYNADNHTFDPQKLFRFVMEKIAIERVVKTAFEQGGVHKHKALLENRTENLTANAGDGTAKLTPQQELAAAAEKIRLAREGSGQQRPIRQFN